MGRKKYKVVYAGNKRDLPIIGYTSLTPREVWLDEYGVQTLTAFGATVTPAGEQESGVQSAETPFENLFDDKKTRR